jgi:tetratricopeptide (TPR) repeat protein
MACRFFLQRTFVATGALVLALAASAADTPAADPHAGHGAGRVDFPVSCKAPARAKFEHGAALLHHMTYPQAREAFAEAATLDPGCAMAHWGVAMTLFQPLWPTRPDLDDRKLGWSEVEQARAAKPPTERERLYVDATAAFFEDPATDDYWARIRRWEAATQRLRDAFPDDVNATAFYALAHLATTPADRVTRDHADRAAALLLQVLAKDPNHPGAMHYLVHANDVPGRERESLDITRRYESVAPDNPHALHMPTHVYVRLGDWDGVVRGNLRSADAALRYPAGDHGEYVWDEFPHAIDYLVYAYLQQGNDAAAAAQRDRLWKTEGLQPSFKVAFHLAATQARCALEPRDWNAAAAIVPGQPVNVEWAKYPWPAAIAQFAHGMGASHLGRAADAKAALAQLVALEAKSDAAKETLFARNIRVLRLELEATIADADRRGEAGLALLREAAAIEASTPKAPVTPGPIVAAEEWLGDALLARGDGPGALAAYKRALALYPNRRHAQSGVALAATEKRAP